MTFPFLFGSVSRSDDSSDGVNGLDSPLSNRAASQRRKSDQEDALLVKGIGNGEEKALGLLIDKYSLPLSRFAYTITDSYDMAEDVADDIFIWLWENRLEIRIQGSVKSYLYRAARNRALNSKRNSAYRYAWEDNNREYIIGLNSDSINSDSTEKRIEERELGAVLRSAIESLGEKRRTAIRLRWMEELSYAEIAEVMDVSAVAVKNLINRALKDLRDMLPDYLK